MHVRPRHTWRERTRRAQGQVHDALGVGRHALDAAVALYRRLFTAEVPGEATGEPFDDLDPDSRELLEHCKLETALGDTAPGQVVQFERLGYFAHDPRQALLFHRTVGLKDEWANIQKRS